MSTKLERLVKTAKLIADNQYPNIEYLCTVYEVSERTIYDDIRAFKEKLGLDITYDKFKNGYKFNTLNQSLPKFELTEGEFFSLAVGNLMATYYASSLLKNDLLTILDKIKDRLPEKFTFNIEDLNNLIKFKSDPIVNIDTKVFNNLYKACKNFNQIQIEYFSASKNEMSSRLVLPYCLQNHKNTWYLVAHCTSMKDTRCFALHRLKNVKVLNVTFTPPKQETLNNWLSTAFQLEHSDTVYNFKIKFKDIAARHIKERIWHESQKLSVNDDNSLILEFQASSIDEIKRWVLTWGVNAIVLEPQNLINEIVNEISRIKDQYD